MVDDAGTAGLKIETGFGHFETGFAKSETGFVNGTPNAAIIHKYEWVTNISPIRKLLKRSKK